MWASIQAPLFFGLIAAFVTTIGLIIVSQRTAWSERHAGIFGLAAAGMLTTLAFVHIIPEAFRHSQSASVWLAAGFFGGLLLHKGVETFFPYEEDSRARMAAVTPVLAIAIHSFIDGVVYAVTFAASFTSGVYASLSLTLHEFPEGVIAFAILRRFGVSNRNAFLLAFLAAAATTPLGVIASGPFMYGLGSEAIGALFAASAGLLIFVATGPLMAPIRETRPVRGLGAVAAGVVLAALVVNLRVPHHLHSDMESRHEMPAPAPSHS